MQIMAVGVLIIPTAGFLCLRGLYMNNRENMTTPIQPVIPAIASAAVWGSGQLINRQYIKGSLYLFAQLFFVFAELVTGNYASASFSIREDGGFFLHGLWGIVTLGSKPRQMTLAGLTDGDHSVILMINGIIASLIIIAFVMIYIINIRDAFLTRKRINEGYEILSSLEGIKQRWYSSFHYFILIPGLLLIVFLLVLPVIFSILIAFTNFSKGNLPPVNLLDWVGIRNFLDIFRMPVWSSTFFSIFGWTFIWAVLATLSCYFAGLFQAVIINNKRVRFKKIWRGILILPWAIPGMVSLLVFRTMLNGQFGPISQFLLDIGLTTERISWLSDPQNPNLAKVVILVVNLWLGFPYFMALTTGVLTSMSKDILEAARVDGATPFQEFWRITFPMIFKVTSPLLIMGFAGNFNNFGVIYFLSGGGPGNANYQFAGSTDILITWIYKLTIDHQFYNMAAVMSTMIFLIIGTISVWNFTRTRAFKEDEV